MIIPRRIRDRTAGRVLESCESCRTFAAEVLVPNGDGASRVCWICAHAVAEHEISVAHAHAHTCDCTARQIYPHDVRDKIEGVG